jgi:hypothetical protein
MFVVIEIDSSFSLGIDWGKETKGIRLGYLSIQFVPISFNQFIFKFRPEWKEWKNKGSDE